MRPVLLLLVWPVAVAIGACGARVDSGGDGGAPPSATSSQDEGGSSDTGGSGSSSGVAVPLCPTDAPAAGTRCPAPGQGCAYVSFGSGGCQAFLCSDQGVWQSTTEGC